MRSNLNVGMKSEHVGMKSEHERSTIITINKATKIQLNKVQNTQIIQLEIPKIAPCQEQ